MGGLEITNIELIYIYTLGIATDLVTCTFFFQRASAAERISGGVIIKGGVLKGGLQQTKGGFNLGGVNLGGGVTHKACCAWHAERAAGRGAPRGAMRGTQDRCSE